MLQWNHVCAEPPGPGPDRSAARGPRLRRQRSCRQASAEGPAAARPFGRAVRRRGALLLGAPGARATPRREPRESAAGSRLAVADLGCVPRRTARSSGALPGPALEQRVRDRAAAQLRGDLHRGSRRAPFGRTARGTGIRRHRAGDRRRHRPLERRRGLGGGDSPARRASGPGSLRLLGARQQLHSAHQRPRRPPDRGNQGPGGRCRELGPGRAARPARSVDLDHGRERGAGRSGFLRPLDRALHPGPA